MKYEHPVTPAEISPALKNLCEEILPNSVPIYVDVSPLEGVSQNDCFPHVQHQIDLHGGEMLIGWALWEMPGLFVEAEFHCVWRTVGGQVVDIAPKAQPTARVLFLHDPAATYHGLQVNNIRRSLRDDVEIQQFLASFDEMYEFMNRGERAGQYGEVIVQGEDARELEFMQRRAYELEQVVKRRYPQHDPYLPCPCGCGKKARWCDQNQAVHRS